MCAHPLTGSPKEERTLSSGKKIHHVPKRTCGKNRKEESRFARKRAHFQDTLLHLNVKINIVYVRVICNIEFEVCTKLY